MIHEHLILRRDLMQRDRSIVENVSQSFRTRQNRDLDLSTVSHTSPKPGHYTIAVKVIDVFGNDTMTLMPISVGSTEFRQSLTLVAASLLGHDRRGT
jgi:hypothetical protein